MKPMKKYKHFFLIFGCLLIFQLFNCKAMPYYDIPNFTLLHGGPAVKYSLNQALIYGGNIKIEKLLNKRITTSAKINNIKLFEAQNILYLNSSYYYNVNMWHELHTGISLSKRFVFQSGYFIEGIIGSTIFKRYYIQNPGKWFRHFGISPEFTFNTGFMFNKKRIPLGVYIGIGLEYNYPEDHTQNYVGNIGIAYFLYK